METHQDGLIPPDSAYGFFVNETRLLSRYEYLIDDIAPQPVAVSSVREHSFLGYYAVLPPDREPTERDGGSGGMEEISAADDRAERNLATSAAVFMKI